MVSRDVRRTHFAQFIDRALTDARARGMTIPDIQAATGVAPATFYRWRTGNWTKDPRPSQVKNFCLGLELPVEAAYRTLDWQDAPAAVEPVALEHPSLREIARRLQDPNVSRDEKAFIEESLRMLVARGTNRRPVT